MRLDCRRRRGGGVRSGAKEEGGGLLVFALWEGCRVWTMAPTTGRQRPCRAVACTGWVAVDLAAAGLRLTAEPLPAAAANDQRPFPMRSDQQRSRRRAARHGQRWGARRGCCGLAARISLGRPQRPTNPAAAGRARPTACGRKQGAPARTVQWCLATVASFCCSPLPGALPLTLRRNRRRAEKPVKRRRQAVAKDKLIRPCPRQNKE